MKNRITLLLVLISCIAYDQYKRGIIDSIHTNRLCESYPGLTKELLTEEAYNDAEFVFTGKIVEIIRIEKMKLTDIRTDEEGKTIPINFEAMYFFSYVLKVDQVFKGEIKGGEMKIHSKIFSGMLPMLLLEKNYLIYASKPMPELETQGLPYISCNGNSCHIKYAENDIKELNKIKTSNYCKLH